MSRNSVKINVLYQILFQILTLILPIITSPYIARVIGAEGLGVYTYSFSVAYYFVLFSMLGLTNYGNRSIAQVRDNKEQLSIVFSSILWVHVIISLACIIVYILYAVSLKEDQIYAWMQLLYVISGLLDINWFYFGIERFKMIVARNTIIRIITVIFVFTFVKTYDDLWIYCLIMSLGNFLSQLSLWLSLGKYVTVKRVSFKEMSVHIKPLLILFIPAIAVSLYKYMDKIMIGLLSSKAQLGYYENAEKITNIPVTIIQSFGIVLLPKISNLMANNDKKSTVKYIGLSMKYVMWLAFALAFGLAAVGTTFATFFWGNDFIVSGRIIMGLSMTIPFITFANILRTQFLIPSERDKDYVFSVVCGAVVNLIVNAILIGKIGSIGAMIGTIVAEVTVCIIQALSVRKELDIVHYVKGCIPPAFLGIVMFIMVYYERILNMRPVLIFVIQISTGACIYFICSYIYFKITKDTYITQLEHSFFLRIKKH